MGKISVQLTSVAYNLNTSVCVMRLPEYVALAQ